MKFKIIVFAFLIGITYSLNAQEMSSSKSEKIHDLLDILGSEEQYQSFINVGLDNIVAKYGNKLAETDKKILKEEAINLVKTFMNEDLHKIYDKYLSKAEIEDLIEFYSSETGRRFRQVQPMITQEISQVLMSKYMEDFKQVIADRLTAGN